MGIGGRKAGHGGAKGLPLLHTLQDEIDAVAAGALHAPLCGTDVILLARLRLGPFDGNMVTARERLYPIPILIGPPREHLLVDHLFADHVMEKMHHLSRPRQPTQIAPNPALSIE